MSVLWCWSDNTRFRVPEGHLEAVFLPGLERRERGMCVGGVSVGCRDGVGFGEAGVGVKNSRGNRTARLGGAATE
jgi:hypothetical protein